MLRHLLDSRIDMTKRLLIQTFIALPTEIWTKVENFKSQTLCQSRMSTHEIKVQRIFKEGRQMILIY